MYSFRGAFHFFARFFDRACMQILCVSPARSLHAFSAAHAAKQIYPYQHKIRIVFNSLSLSFEFS
jgi:hypothetical protein